MKWFISPYNFISQSTVKGNQGRNPDRGGTCRQESWRGPREVVLVVLNLIVFPVGNYIAPSATSLGVLLCTVSQVLPD